MAVNQAAQQEKTVADPTTAYESVENLWQKSRVACSGERLVKDYDSYLDTTGFRNLLIPFSPSMSQQQYDFYKAEAEWPGIVAQYSKMLVGGLLRKQPSLELPEGLPEGANEWIMDHFGQDNSPLVHFLDSALWEEVQTSRAWIYVDYPKVTNPELLLNEDFQKLKPYPVLWSAESVINWKVSTDATGNQQLTMIVYKGYVEEYTTNEFHPTYRSTVWVHEIVEGKYQIRVFQKEDADASKTKDKASKAVYKLVDTITNIMANNKPLSIIPAWPLNGSIDTVEPFLMPLVDREISLYNKISRRNHLLYGASTYTPVITADISDEDFEEIVGSGLGSWIKLPFGSTASVLETPTAALQDMERAIATSIEDMAKLGIKMLTPEVSQSGVALEIRNAAQTAQLGTLNTKVSNTISDIITFMLNWKYDLALGSTDVKFTLSADFNPTPLGADWLRLVTEWYQAGLLPRSAWLMLLKQNDLIDPDYNDEDGQLEINDDELINKINGATEDPNYLDKINGQ